MKRMLVLFLITKVMALQSLIFVFSNGYCETTSKESESDFHIRKAKFGMPLIQVKKSEEDKPLEETENALIYEDKVMDLEVFVSYHFVNNQLFQCGYHVVEEYLNKNNHIDDYQKLKKALIEKYGKPVYDREIWKDPFYKDKPHRYGDAVSMGNLYYVAEWEKSMKGDREIRISIVLSGENFDIKHRISYTDIHIEKIYEEQKKEKEGSKL